MHIYLHILHVFFFWGGEVKLVYFINYKCCSIAFFLINSDFPSFFFCFFCFHFSVFASLRFVSFRSFLSFFFYLLKLLFLSMFLGNFIPDVMDTAFVLQKICLFLSFHLDFF